MPTDPTRLRRRPLGRYRYTRLRWRVLFAVVDAIGAGVTAVGRGVRAMEETIRRTFYQASLARLRERVARNEPREGGWKCPGPSDLHDALTPGPSPAARARGEAVAAPDLEPQRILLVQLDHLGDAIITTVMLPLLRRRWPKASIEVLASPWNQAVFRACPEVDRVHLSRVNRFNRGGRWGWMWATIGQGLALRAFRYDLAIDVRGEFPLALVLWLSGARRRLGWVCGGGGFLLTDSPTYVPDRPEVESRLALLERLGIRPDPDNPPCPTFGVDPAAQAEAARHWAELADLRSHGPRVVFHIGAGTPAKQWPVEHWRELLGRTITEFDAQVMLVGSATDRIIARRILGPAAWPNVVDGTGRLSLMELAGVLQQADLLVGADSGPAHLAAAVGTPVVALFSGTNSSRQWQPRGPQVAVVRNPVPCSPCHRERCPLAEHPCMRGMRPEEVAAGMREGIRDQGSGIRGQGSGVRDQGSGVRGQGSGVRGQGSGSRGWGD